MQNLYNVLRLTVLPQMNAYREIVFADVEDTICPVTGDRVVKQNSRVNHHPRSFQSLAWEWMIGEGLIYEVDKSFRCNSKSPKANKCQRFLWVGPDLASAEQEAA